MEVAGTTTHVGWMPAGTPSTTTLLDANIIHVVLALDQSEALDVFWAPQDDNIVWIVTLDPTVPLICY